MRADHPAEEVRSLIPPDRLGLTGLKAGPFRPHDGLVEVDQWLGNSVEPSPAPEDVRFLGDKRTVFEHIERVGQVGRLTAYEIGDAAVSAVSRGYRAKHRVIQGRIADLGFLGQQVARLAKQR